jgi:hypothetical protein
MPSRRRAWSSTRPRSRLRASTWRAIPNSQAGAQPSERRIEAANRGQSLGKGLRGQVGGEIPATRGPQEEGGDGPLVARVERGEGVLVTQGRGEELLIGAPIACHHHLSLPSRRDSVTARAG